MRCPGCAAEIDFKKDACPACGVVYLDALVRRAEARSTRAVPVRTPSSRLSYAAAAGALVLAAGALVWSRLGAAPPPAGSLIAPQLGLSFVPPAGWAFEPRPDGLSLSRGPAGLRLASRPGAVEPRRLASALFNGAHLRLSEPEPAALGGRSALRLRLGGERAVLPGAPQPVEWEGWLVVAQDGATTYAVAAWSEKEDFARRAPELERFLSSVLLTSN